MLNNTETLKRYGYTYDELSDMSSKKVVLICDYCSAEIVKPKKARLTSNKYLDKDSCNLCRFKKREELSILKYGVKNSAQRSEVRDKIKSSKKNINDVKRLEKFKKTMMEKYGVENPSQIECNKEKYVSNNPMKREDVRSRARETNIARRGTPSFLGTTECKAAFKAKYGVDNAGQLPDHAEKSKITSMKKFGVTHFLKNKDNAAAHGKIVLESIS